MDDYLKNLDYFMEIGDDHGFQQTVKRLKEAMVTDEVMAQVRSIGDKEEVLTVSKSGGVRYNGAKPKLSVVPPSLEEAVAEVLWASAKENGGKYPLHNWRKGLPYTETADSALRHIKAFVHKLHEGDLDQDSGLHHLKHAATNIAFLLHFISNPEEYGQLDDRYLERGDS